MKILEINIENNTRDINDYINDWISCKEEEMKNLKRREKELYLWKTWEVNIRDRKIKINHNPEINLRVNRSEKHTTKTFKVCRDIEALKLLGNHKILWSNTRRS